MAKEQCWSLEMTFLPFYLLMNLRGKFKKKGVMLVFKTAKSGTEEKEQVRHENIN